MKPGGVRVRQAAAFAAGAVAYLLVVGQDGERFLRTPLVLGLVYLLAAALGGRRGGHWATACVLVGWGAAVVVADEADPDLDRAGLYAAGLGAGGLAAAALARRGFAADAPGITGTILAAGLLLALSTQVDLLTEPALYAGALVAVAAVNLVLARRRSPVRA